MGIVSEVREGGTALALPQRCANPSAPEGGMGQRMGSGDAWLGPLQYIPNFEGATFWPLELRATRPTGTFPRARA